MWELNDEAKAMLTKSFPRLPRLTNAAVLRASDENGKASFAAPHVSRQDQQVLAGTTP
jgi:hypothetical protein